MSGPVLAISRYDVARYVETLVILYIVLIFIRVLVSFLPRIPYNPVLRGFLDFVEAVTEPYLGLFRRFLPAVRLGPAALDLTPMVATIALVFVGLYLVVPLIRG
jgi:YggT family protein